VNRRVSVVNSLRFFGRCLADPIAVGSVAPSSQCLAQALTAPLAARSSPARVLEIGAGTGAVTRRLGELMGPADHLDICEIDPTFVRILRRTVLASGPLATARLEGRVCLLHCAVQEIRAPQHYDYIISGLPLSVFDSHELRDILESIQRSLRPGGFFSYFEYACVRRLLKVSPSRRWRRRIRAVSRLLDAHIRDYQVAQRMVLRNLPPAHARHWRFDSTVGAQPVEVPHR
jgi:phospholipid N-methyltransferase